mmetsp:Transcript_29112/g.79480  ORF Transcript_29112/g.79480 Transcript_29112/m.79480 type:complete len:164 (-) Transcript_29112:75-566(-)
MVQPVKRAPAPIRLRSPTREPMTHARSCTTEPAPIEAGALPSPRITEAYHAEAPSPIVTAPTKLEEGATNPAAETLGDCPETLTAVQGMGTVREWGEGSQNTSVGKESGHVYRAARAESRITQMQARAAYVCHDARNLPVARRLQRRSSVRPGGWPCRWRATR